MSARVAVIILNWNGADDTLVCLASLEAQTYKNFLVILVDNGSTEDEIDRLRAYRAPYQFELLLTGKNLGYAGGNNLGVRHAIDAGVQQLLILNNDTTVAPELLEKLVGAAERNIDAGILSARIFYSGSPSTVWFDGGYWNEEILHMEWPGQDADVNDLPTMVHETDYASGAAMFFRTDVVKKIGLLDERYFLVWEEADWCYRARAAGWKVLVIPDAKVWHKVGASFGSESSPLRTYFSTRNELLWFQHHATRTARARLALKTLDRLVPKFFMSRDPDIDVRRRLLWAVSDYLQGWLGRGTRFEYLSKRRAIVDYLRRRFGDCPPEVRAWSSAWAARRSRT